MLLFCCQFLVNVLQCNTVQISIADTKHLDNRFFIEVKKCKRTGTARSKEKKSEPIQERTKTYMLGNLEK